MCSTSGTHDDYVCSSDDDDLDYMASTLFFLTQDEPSPLTNVARVPSMLQFFIRVSGGNDIVMRANTDDTVASIHDRLYSITRIPVSEQKLKYKGKHLKRNKTLAECLIENDVSVQLIGRTQSAKNSRAWLVCHDIVSVILRLRRGERIHNYAEKIKIMVNEFVSLIPNGDDEDDNGSASDHLQTFLDSSAIDAIVMLYKSSALEHKDCASISVFHLLEPSRAECNKHFAPLVLEFCKMLRGISHVDNLYLFCWTNFMALLKVIGVTKMLDKCRYNERVIVVSDLYPFVSELETKLSEDLALSMHTTTGVGPLLQDVHKLRDLLLPLRNAIFEDVESYPISLEHPSCSSLITFLHNVFVRLLRDMDRCLSNIEERYAESNKTYCGWFQYLPILKELESISKLIEDAEEEYWTILSLRKFAVRALTIRYSRKHDDHHWLFDHKDVTDFKSRRALAMCMFPEEIPEGEQLAMTIDRSQLVADSFAFITFQEAGDLQDGLSVIFKNEVAGGFGVLREWLFLVCQAIFKSPNGLFVACPNDQRRFYPNPVSKEDPVILEYFRFSGHLIAMALRYQVQVGICFDRTFFLQLARMGVSLEDIKDTDPQFYRSCKSILDMDVKLIDTDVLGLTFSKEVDESGCKRVVELCPGGETIVVNSNNRDAYVSLVINHTFVSSISEQVSYFKKGIGDILYYSVDQELFFRNFELEDLDMMLYGNEHSICVDDWKAHTKYHGYKEDDTHVYWFWTVVETMSDEQKKALLFFWTSLRYLPVEGFSGLKDPLCINMSDQSDNHLPSSSTCFYLLKLPVYPSMSVMQERLYIITQEHIIFTFGNE